MDVVGDLMLLSDNPFDFHAEMGLLLTIFSNTYKLVRTLNTLAFHDLQNDPCHKFNLNQTLESLLFYLPLLLILL